MNLDNIEIIEFNNRQIALETLNSGAQVIHASGGSISSNALFALEYQRQNPNAELLLQHNTFQIPLKGCKSSKDVEVRLSELSRTYENSPAGKAKKAQEEAERMELELRRKAAVDRMTSEASDSKYQIPAGFKIYPEYPEHENSARRATTLALEMLDRNPNLMQELKQSADNYELMTIRRPSPENEFAQKLIEKYGEEELRGGIAVTACDAALKINKAGWEKFLENPTAVVPSRSHSVD